MQQNGQAQEFVCHTNFPSIWERIGKSAQDEARRNSEENLKKDAEEFATAHGWHQEFVQEHSFVPDYSKNGDEWNEMLVAKYIPGIGDSFTAFDQLEEMATEHVLCLMQLSHKCRHC